MSNVGCSIYNSVENKKKERLITPLLLSARRPLLARFTFRWCHTYTIPTGVVVLSFLVPGSQTLDLKASSGIVSVSSLLYHGKDEQSISLQPKYIKALKLCQMEFYSMYNILEKRKGNRSSPFFYLIPRRRLISALTRRACSPL